MELVSEKLHNLYIREDEIKKQREKNNKKIDLLNKKLDDLNAEKIAINNYLKSFRITKIGALVDLALLDGFVVYDLIKDLIGKARKEKAKERKAIIIKKMLIIIKNKKALKEENRLLKLELEDVKKQIREL